MYAMPYKHYMIVVLPSTSSLHQSDHSNIGIIIHDGLSLFKVVNFVINYTIHCIHSLCANLWIVEESQSMTQVISSVPFSHSSWNMYSPLFRKNILHKSNKISSYVISFNFIQFYLLFTIRLTIHDIVTKKQLQLLCSIVNSTFEVCLSVWNGNVVETWHFGKLFG